MNCTPTHCSRKPISRVNTSMPPGPSRADTTWALRSTSQMISAVASIAPGVAP